MKWIVQAMYDEGDDWPDAPGVESVIEADTADAAEKEYVRIHGDHFHGGDWFAVREATAKDIERITALDPLSARGGRLKDQ